MRQIIIKFRKVITNAQLDKIANVSGHLDQSAVFRDILGYELVRARHLDPILSCFD